MLNPYIEKPNYAKSTATRNHKIMWDKKWLNRGFKPYEPLASIKEEDDTEGFLDRRKIYEDRPSSSPPAPTVSVDTEGSNSWRKPTSSNLWDRIHKKIQE